MMQREGEVSASDALVTDLSRYEESFDVIDEIEPHRLIRLDMAESPGALVQQVKSEMPYFFE
jgi:hypothetical protein